MPSKYRFPVKDYSNEQSSVSLNVADAVTDGQLTALYNAIGDVILGTQGNAVLSDEVDKDAGSSALPANAFAQREMKWLISYSDNVTGKVYRKEIPTADLADLATNTDLLDVGVGTDGEALVTAFEAAVVSPDGNPVTFISASFIGKNL